MLIDTDVIIWYMRGNEKSHELISNNIGFHISVVTYMELVQGMKNKHELITLRKTLKKWRAQIVYIDQEISSKAMFYVEQHFLSHALELADSLIAATAVSAGLPLVTGNDKHFKAIRDITLTKFWPD